MIEALLDELSRDAMQYTKERAGFEDALNAIRARLVEDEGHWKCDWQPDELNPGLDCPYCAGEMCARFDNLNCTHDRIERHGYPRPAEDAGRHRPQWLDGVPTGWCECGAVYPHIVLAEDEGRLREAAEHVIDAWDHFESKHDLTTSLADLRAALAAAPEPRDTP